MGLAYAAADLALSRAGGTTLAELAHFAVPAILVPFPGATDDHQRWNAEAVAATGAAAVFPERKLAVAGLDGIAALLRDDSRRESMGLAMASLSRPEAASRIADEVIGLVEGRS